MDITVVDAGADDDDGLSGVATACHTLAGHENTSPTVPANGKRRHRVPWIAVVTGKCVAVIIFCLTNHLKVQPTAATALCRALFLVPTLIIPDHAALLYAAGAAVPPSSAEALKQMATRIVAFKEGDFSPSPPPYLLDKLTDYDLIVAVDAVWLVAAEQQPPPSGKARYRLLAWTVADARGAAEPLSKGTAEKVGKRLEA